MNYRAVQDIISDAIQQNKKISELVLKEQSKQLERPSEDLTKEMEHNLKVMEEAVNSGIKSTRKSSSGLSGGDAYKLKQALDSDKTLGGATLDKALMKALAVSEVNACMGRIVAAPTAGSCGIIPAVVFTVKEEKKIPDSIVIQSLFTAAGIGMVIANRASISGAEGGCQAECGSASAMAAAALVEMAGGTPQMIGHACAIALKNTMGLVCDPVAGLVEVPCVKRNAMGAANALAAADLALAGVESVIPVDEVIDAMQSVSQLMSPALKETAEGGLASTPTAKRVAGEVLSS